VTQRPVINWTSWLLTTDMSAFGARYWFKKMPWKIRRRTGSSHAFFGGNVTTPTMVLVGLNDLRYHRRRGGAVLPRSAVQARTHSDVLHSGRAARASAAIAPGGAEFGDH